MKLSTKIITPLLATTIGLSSLNAATVGYWRFEDPDNIGLDSGPNGLELVVDGEVTASELPKSGPGSRFWNPIPKTGEPNRRSAVFANTSSRDRLTYSPYHDEGFPTSDFTVEALFHFVAHTDYQTLIGHWQTDSNRRGWLLRISTEGEVTFTYSTDGTTDTSATIDTGIFLTPNTDYYLAMAFNSKLGKNITFWIQDLTTGTPLTESTVPNEFGVIYNPATSLEIGGVGALGTPEKNTRNMQSRIDEIRLSSGVLSAAELLSTSR